MTDTAIVWDTSARQRPERRTTNARGETTWFNWTQYPSHGPGAELLDLPSGDRVLDLGCGKGGNAAHLARLGMDAVGVDVSAVQLRAAEDRWGGMPGLTLVRADALSYLREAEPFDAVYSVSCGSRTQLSCSLRCVSGCDRAASLCSRSGRPSRGCYGCQASYIPRGTDEDPLVVKRWDYEPPLWEHLLGMATRTCARRCWRRRPARAPWALSSSRPASDSCGGPGRLIPLADQGRSMS